MNKNRKFLKSLLVALIGVGAMVSVSQAVTLKINYEDLKIQDNFAVLSTGNVSPIHFADNGNSFGGFFYFTSVDASESTALSWNDYVAKNEVDPCECTKTGENGDPENLDECTDTDNEVTYSCLGDHVILKEPSPYRVSAGSGTYNCRSQVKGFYYNSQRGERLWPIDEETLGTWGIADAELTGGIYTRCSKAGYEDALEQCIKDGDCVTEEQIRKLQEGFYDTWSYYGMIEHKYQGQKWQLIMGVNYEKKNPRFEPASLLKISSTFQRLGNKYPVGFIYDYNGGLGFVGCKVTSESVLGELLDKIEATGTVDRAIGYEERMTPADIPNNNGLDCKDVGSATDSLIGLIVDGLVGMGTNTDSPGIAGNTTSQKMQYFGSVDVNNATLINFTKQKAEDLCRGKWVENKNSCGNDEKVCCIDNKNDSNPIVAPKNKTLIVKNGNVKVSPISFSNETDYYDIFIDVGNLLIDENNGNNKFVIGRNGFIYDGISVDDFRNSVETHYGGSDTPYTGTGVAVASVIRGNFIVNGGIKNSNSDAVLKNKYFIYGKFTTNKTYDQLQGIFTRKCNAGLGSDENRCPDYDATSPYKNAFLVVIDQNYDSPLYW